MAALHPNLAASTPLTNKEGKENKRAEPAPLAREPRKPHRERERERGGKNHKNKNHRATQLKETGPGAEGGEAFLQLQERTGPAGVSGRPQPPLAACRA